jgi:guanosine-3',5'-bis(diphosphate) 3'-pyrophosphohydrolase
MLGIVAELTDDKSLDKVERKRLQIVNANKLTPDAIIVRLADKISNLRDLNRITPVG